MSGCTNARPQALQFAIAVDCPFIYWCMCHRQQGFPGARGAKHFRTTDPCMVRAGLLKAGRTAAASAETLQQCLHAARLRHKQLSTVLSQSLQAVGLPSHDR